MSNRRLLSGLAALILLSAGCGGGGGQAPVPVDFALRLERQLCYGPCPVYAVDVDARGEVSYRGEYFVRVKEERKGRVGMDALRRILAALDGVEFFSIEDQYAYFGPGCERITPDAQTVVVTAKRAGVTHRVRHYFGCHTSDPILDELIDMELEIDHALDTRQWVFCTEDDTFFTTHCEPFP